jgi:hypothetical protein
MNTISQTRRRLATAALVSAGVALSGAVYAAIASATWDIEAYDECLKTNHSSNAEYQCCLASGGEWDGGPNFNTIVGTCRAPAPEAQGPTETATPPKVPVPTVTGVQPPIVPTPKPPKAGVPTATGVQPPNVEPTTWGPPPPTTPPPPPTTTTPLPVP